MRAHNNLGWMYHNGEGGPQDIQKAHDYYKVAAEHDDVEAQCNLAWLSRVYGPGSPAKMVDQAEHYYQIAADQESGRAQGNLHLLKQRSNHLPGLDYRGYN